MSDIEDYGAVLSAQEYERLRKKDKSLPAPGGLSLLNYVPKKEFKTLYNAYYSATVPNPPTVVGMMGPLGSGKTTMLLCRPILEVLYQVPPEWDDEAGMYVKKGMYYIVRESYVQMSMTVLKTFLELTEDLGSCLTQIRGEDPKEFYLDRVYPDLKNVKPEMKPEEYPLVRLQIHFVFFGVGMKTPEQCFKSVNMTGAFVNEGMIPERHFAYLQGRIGRYPKSLADGDVFSGSLIVDFNPMDESHWLMENFIFNRKEDHVFYKQPAGILYDDVTGEFEVNPNAENIEHLPPDYYKKQINLYPDKQDRRMLLENKPGKNQAGKAVFADYYDEFLHKSGHNLKPIEDRGIFLYADTAFHPAVTIYQKLPTGQYALFDEVYGINIGPAEFGEQLMDLLRIKYPWVLNDTDEYVLEAGCDPSGKQRGFDENMTSWIKTMTKTCGFKWRAITEGNNVLNTRLDAVKLWLQTRIGKEPALIISENCVMVREAFRSKYFYPDRRNMSAEGIYSDVPIKNHPHSDLMDSVQYAAIRFGFASEVMGKKKKKKRKGMWAGKKLMATQERFFGKGR